MLVIKLIYTTPQRNLFNKNGTISITGSETKHYNGMKGQFITAD